MAEIPIGTVWGDTIYAGPKYGDVSQEEYNKLLESGALGRGQQTVEMVGERLVDHAKNITPDKVKDFIGSGGNLLSDAANSRAGKVVGTIYDWTLKGTVDKTLDILGAPVEATHWVSKKVDPTGRGIGKAPLGIAEAGLTLGAGTIKSGGKALLNKTDDALRLLNQTDNLAYATVGIYDDHLIKNVLKDRLSDSSSTFKPSTFFATSSARANYAGNLSPTDARRGAGYKQETQYPPIIDDAGRKTSDSITDLHHVGELSFQNKAVVEHSSWDSVPTGGKSPIIELAESKYKIRGGNAIENLVDIFGHDIKKLRGARIEEISKQFKGRMHKDTINDLLGSSKLKFGEVQNIEDLTANALHNLRTTKGISKGKLYPEIKIKDTNGKVLEIWQPKTQKDWDGRFTYVRKKLGIKQKLDSKAIKIDPSIDVMGIDHQDAHRITNYYKKLDDGNPMNALNKSIASGEYKNLSVEAATELYVNAHRFQEQVVGHILKYRYQKVKEVFAKYYPDLGAEAFEHLSKARQQDFFRNRAAEIAVKGGIEKRVSKELANTPLTGWTKGMTNVFGWKPQ